MTVGIDTFEFDECGFKKYLLNVICWGTGYQMVATIPDKTAKAARDAFAKYWVRYFGFPELLIADQGTEFIGSAFGNYVGEGGTLLHFIDSQSPMAERTY